MNRDGLRLRSLTRRWRPRRRGAPRAVIMESMPDTDSCGCERRNCVDDFICGHNGAGVVWDIDFESGVHLLIRVARGRVLHHRDLVAKLSGVSNSCLHTGVCYKSRDDEPMNAVLLEL